MAKRKRGRSHPTAKAQRRTKTRLQNSPAEQSKESGPVKSDLRSDPSTVEPPEKAQYGWVTIEHRDSEGNPTFPKRMIQTTYGRRYDEVPDGTKIKALVLAGYKPPLMLVERKIYEIHRMAVCGRRRKGQISFELDSWRSHEAKWFDSFEGVTVQIDNPGLSGPQFEKTEYTITKSSFDKKILTVVGDAGNETEIQMYAGILDIAEQWKSVWKRQAPEILNSTFKWLIIPFSVALGAGLMLFWLN